MAFAHNYRSHDFMTSLLFSLDFWFGEECMWDLPFNSYFFYTYICHFVLANWWVNEWDMNVSIHASICYLSSIGRAALVLLHLFYLPHFKMTTVLVSQPSSYPTMQGVPPYTYYYNNKNNKYKYKYKYK